MPPAKPKCVRCRRFQRIRQKAGAVEPSILDYKGMPPHDEDCPMRKVQL